MSSGRRRPRDFSPRTDQTSARCARGAGGQARRTRGGRRIVWRPQNTVAVNDEQGEKLLKLIESLNEHDDVQNVYANFEVSDEFMQRMAGSCFWGRAWSAEAAVPRAMKLAA